MSGAGCLTANPLLSTTQRGGADEEDAEYYKRILKAQGEHGNGIVLETYTVTQLVWATSRR